MTRTARLVIRICALAASCAAASAFAQAYVGNGLSLPRAKGANPPPLTLAAGAGDKRPNEWKVYGRYQFSETWGAEFNYSDWGKRNQAAAPEAPRGSQLNLSATGTLPITRGLSLTGRLGYGRNEAAASPYCLSAACGPVGGARSEGTRTGVGLRYSFNDSWGMRFDYDNVNPLSDPNGVPQKGDSWSARIRYTF